MSAHKHTNRLINETSPYLLQHAHNPVEWYSWSEEALQRARVEDKPILLSIGYSACHWCHVMEHESFENESIARLMNENFINIKVDREERPDLDQIYMNAVQMMYGHGGWPLTVFLTPELVPFYGGTYFPPEDRYNMPGFPRVVSSVAAAYREKPAEVAETARQLLGALQSMGEANQSSETLSISMLDAAFTALQRNYDPKHGGFGSAPKFPPSMTLEFCLRTDHRTGRAEALEMVTHTCRQMAQGGMYDQLGGGFHRYSTDARWLVPHFEKMLYDNALLARLYLHVYQRTGDHFFRTIAAETLDYVGREMTDERGGFYSTQDADSEGVEGKFFVWTVDEIKALLGAEDGTLVCAYYDVTEAGNFEEKNILHIPRPLEAVAQGERVSVAHLQAVLERARPILYAAREQRVKPGRDEKIITAWNGLMLASFAEAAVILERPDYRERAERNAAFMLEHLQRDGLLLHVYKDGQAKHVAFLDDYACFISGLVTLYEATGHLRWLEAAITLTERMREEFWDEEGGGFFYTAQSGEQLIVRAKDFMDNATPSGNSVAAELLQRLALLTGRESYQRQAVTILRLMWDQMKRYPSAFGLMLSALDFHLSTPQEIVIVGALENAATQHLARQIWQTYLPNKVVAMAEEDNERALQLSPLFQGRLVPGGLPTAYVCEQRTCQQPVTSPTALAAQLASGAGRTATDV